MLLSEIFRSENIFWLAFLDQEAASGNLGGGYCAKRSHLRSPSEMYSCGSVQYDKRIKSERESSRRITQPTLQSLRPANQAVSILGPRRRSRSRSKIANVTWQTARSRWRLFVTCQSQRWAAAKVCKSVKLLPLPSLPSLPAF